MSRIVIIAAMAGELTPLVRGWQHTRVRGVQLWRWTASQPGEPCEYVAVCAGAGAGAASRAFAAAEALGSIDCVISAGWAGALDERFKPGSAWWAGGAIDARTGERFASEEPSELWVVTSPRVAGAEEKQRLADTYGAAMVDMEAAAVARLAAMRAIPFFCLKAISDGFRERLPDLNRFLSPAGRFRLARFVLFAVFRPWCWPALRRMGQNSKKAAHAIREALLAHLLPSGEFRNPNGYPSR